MVMSTYIQSVTNTCIFNMQVIYKHTCVHMYMHVQSTCTYGFANSACVSHMCDTHMTRVNCLTYVRFVLNLFPYVLRILIPTLKF